MCRSRTYPESDTMPSNFPKAQISRSPGSKARHNLNALEGRVRPEADVVRYLTLTLPTFAVAGGRYSIINISSKQA
jgi:hypothetical protein